MVRSEEQKRPQRSPFSKWANWVTHKTTRRAQLARTVCAARPSRGAQAQPPTKKRQSKMPAKECCGDVAVRLLEDVCSYLGGRIEACPEAGSLFVRAKRCLAEHETSCGGPYLDMRGRQQEPQEYVAAEPAKGPEDPHVDLYDFIPSPSPSPGPKKEDAACPFVDLPAKDLDKKAIKYGQLRRKEKKFFIDQQKSCLVGLVNDWLLVYSGKRRPSLVLDMTTCETRPLSDKSFQLLKQTNSKSYQFTASSVQDKDLWLNVLCKRKRDLPELPPLEDVYEPVDKTYPLHSEDANGIYAEPTDPKDPEGEDKAGKSKIHGLIQQMEMTFTAKAPFNEK